MLDEPLLLRLGEAARRQGVDLSSLVRRMLDRQVAPAQITVDAAAEIRRLRESLPPLPDSTPVVRAARDGRHSSRRR